MPMSGLEFAPPLLAPPSPPRSSPPPLLPPPPTSSLHLECLPCTRALAVAPNAAVDARATPAREGEEEALERGERGPELCDAAAVGGVEAVEVEEASEGEGRGRRRRGRRAGGGGGEEGEGTREGRRQ